MPLAKAIPVDTDTADRGYVLTSEAAGTCSLGDVPGLIPDDAYERIGSLHGLAGLQKIFDDPFHENGEAAVGSYPRLLDLNYAMSRVLDWCAESVNERVELAGVEMPQLPLGSVVVAGQFMGSMQVVAETSSRVIGTDVNLG